MRFNIQLNLMAISQFSATEDKGIAFGDIVDLENWWTDSENVTRLELDLYGGGGLVMDVFLNGDHRPSYNYDGSDITDACATGNTITFNCEIDSNSFATLYFLESNGLLNILPHDKTLLYLYRLNDKNIKLTKTLTFISYMEGDFKSPLGIKSIEIDVTGYDISNIYNYVYIPKLSRYYYITNIQLVNKEFTRLILQEDVLMSWKDLIKQQEGYITRWVSSPSKNYLVDNRRPLEDKLTTEKVTVTDTPVADSFVNVELDYSNPNPSPYPNILVVSMSTEVQNYQFGKCDPPTNSGLPDITTDFNSFEWVNFISPDELFYLTLAYLSSSANASFIESVVLLPFNPTAAFGLTTSSSNAIYVKDKYIDHLGRYQSSTSSEAPLKCWRIDHNKGSVCPYLIIKDFTLSASDNFFDREPFANYELYVPFVGYVKLETNKIYDKRILVYYTIDFKTGMTTAYVYNYTDKYVLWSGTCQLGIKIDMTTTNREENIKQKQANDLNMLIGSVSSMLSIGVGAVTSNPVAVAGGVLGLGKTLAGYVNANNQIFERANMSYGTSNGALHSPKECALIKSYHKPLNISLTTYGRTEGYPYNYYRGFSELTGYAEIGDINFDSLSQNIYNDEVTEIIALLKNGVIF